MISFRKSASKPISQAEKSSSNCTSHSMGPHHSIKGIYSICGMLSTSKAAVLTRPIYFAKPSLPSTLASVECKQAQMGLSLMPINYRDAEGRRASKAAWDAVSLDHVVPPVKRLQVGK